MSNTTTGGESIRLILAIACVASVMCVTSAQAQGTEVTRTHEHNQDHIISDVNPCNGLPVSGLGHSNTQFTFRPAPIGFDVTMKLFENGQVTVVGDPTVRYQYSFSDSLRFRSSANFKFTTQIRKRIVRQGPHQGQPDDSYFSYDNITITPHTDPLREKIKVECK